MSRFGDLLKQAENAHKTKSVLSVESIGANPSLQWSEEQQEFLNTAHPKMVLTALAGSGKTSLLLEYARRRPHQKWNFLVFNKSTADDVANKAPKNMTVQTAHKMAFSHFGHDLHHKIKENFSNSQVATYISPKVHKEELKSVTDLVINTLYTYLQSSDFVANEQLISSVDWLNFQEQYPETSINKDSIINFVKNLWNMALDPSSDLIISHDVYLKRFSMVEGFWKGDFWMLDEGQDWSDAFLNRFKTSTRCSIRAGDPFQKLYTWRGASKQKWCDLSLEKEFWLTRSYRTGAECEPWVNIRLKALGCSRKWVGSSKENSVVHLDEKAESIVEFGPDVILASRWEELKRISDILKTSGIQHTMKMQDNCTSSIGPVLSTVHSVKGLEFNRVWIADNCLNPSDHSYEQSRLAYVALTRCKQSVRVPSAWPLLPPKTFQSSVFED